MIKLFYHMVILRIWPYVVRFVLVILVVEIIRFFKGLGAERLFVAIVGLLTVAVQWWRDVRREGVGGDHPINVFTLLKLGMLWFIASEVFFFIGFFWGYFHYFLGLEYVIGGVWPTRGVIAIAAISVPLLNTLVLYFSGIFLTWRHSRMIKFFWSQRQFGFVITLLLGLFFVLLQILEYNWRPFIARDSNYGSIFFVATGFHGFHVIIGIVFLLVRYVRLIKNYFCPSRHVGFTRAIWYWHFVDVVWLWLFSLVYCWGT